MRKIILIIGAPGSGKGSRIDTCVKEGYTPISTSTLIHAAGIDTSHGKLIDDSVVIPLVTNAIVETAGDIILDGFPRNVSQAEALERENVKVDKIIYIKISEDEAVKRALNRLICSSCKETYSKTAYKPPKVDGVCDKCGAKLMQRADDNEQSLRKRFEVFKKETYPILDFYKARGYEISEFDAETNADEDILLMI